MIEITFSKAGAEDIILTEDDLHDWSIRQKCFDNTFELGGVCAAELYLLIDNADVYSRNAFANTTITVRADGELLGTFAPELPKRRDGIVEITAYDDMVKLDEEYKQEDDFPIIFWNAYKGIAAKIGIPEENIIYDDVLGGSGGIGFLNQDFETLMPAQSYRNVLAGMAQFNGSFATITPDKKLLIKAFGKTVVREFVSTELLDYDYSDETITFSKIIVEVAKSRNFEGGGRVELGDDTGYTLVLDRTYINGGLNQDDYMQLIDYIWTYYTGFSLTPMELTLPDPDYSLRLGDRIRLYVAADDVTVEGNISAIEYTDSPVAQVITCGGFGGSGTSKMFSDSKSTANTIEQKVEKAGGGVGEWTDKEHTSEIFNSYVDNAVEGITSKRNIDTGHFNTTKGYSNENSGTVNFVGGRNNKLSKSEEYDGENFVYGSGWDLSKLRGVNKNVLFGRGNTFIEETNGLLAESYIFGSSNYFDLRFNSSKIIDASYILGNRNTITSSNSMIFGNGNQASLSKAGSQGDLTIVGDGNKINDAGNRSYTFGYGNEITNFTYGAVVGAYNEATNATYSNILGYQNNFKGVAAGAGGNISHSLLLGVSNTITNGWQNSVLGSYNEVSRVKGNVNHNNIFGEYNKSSGEHVYMFGERNKADETISNSYTIGIDNEILQSSSNSFVFGKNNDLSSVNSSYIFGEQCSCSDDESSLYNVYMLGYNLTATNAHEIAIGKYNTTKEGQIFSIGIGENGHRFNLLETVQTYDPSTGGYNYTTTINTDIDFTGNITINGVPISSPVLQGANTSETSALESRISTLEQQVAELTALLQKGKTDA